VSMFTGGIRDVSVHMKRCVALGSDMGRVSIRDEYIPPS
jgi:hypothetical protein